MRAREETPNVLVVTETPWGFRTALLIAIVALCWGLYDKWGETHWIVRVFLGLFAALMAFLYDAVAQQVTARFDRLAGQITIERRGVFRARTEHYPFSTFKRAYIEDSRDSDGSTFRLVLGFSEPMLSMIDFDLRERLEKQKKRTSSTLPLHDVPFIGYLSSGHDRHQSIADAINSWARVSPG